MECVFITETKYESGFSSSSISSHRWPPFSPYPLLKGAATTLPCKICTRVSWGGLWDLWFLVFWVKCWLFGLTSDRSVIQKIIILASDKTSLEMDPSQMMSRTGAASQIFYSQNQRQDWDFCCCDAFSYWLSGGSATMASEWSTSCDWILKCFSTCIKFFDWCHWFGALNIANCSHLINFETCCICIKVYKENIDYIDFST